MDADLIPTDPNDVERWKAGVCLVNGRPLVDPDAAPPPPPRRKVDAALKLAARGFRVFPLAPGAKSPPLVAKWPALATTDQATIRAWWAATPDANPGIHCAGLIVLDVDVRKGGEAAIAALREQHDLPRTLLVRTPSGGYHLFYSLPPNHPGVPNGVAVLGAGIDVRSTNGYVVAPGATTEAGRYRIELDAPIQPAPGWLIERLGARTTRARPAAPAPGADADTLARAIEWLRSAPPAIQGQGGDSTTYRTAASLRDFGLDRMQATEALLEHWNPRCAPPWNPVDLAAKVDNAYRYAQNAPGTAVVRPDELRCAAPEPTLDDLLGTTPEPTLEDLLGDASAPSLSDLLGASRPTVTHATIPTAQQALDDLLAGQSASSARAASQPAKGPRSISDFIATRDTAQGYVVKGLLQRGSYGVMYGAPGSGKTFLALDIAYHVAAGQPWMGRRVQQGAVLYLAFEGAGGLASRAKALRERYGFDDSLPLFLDDTPYNLREVSGRRALGEALAALPAKPALIVIDTLAHALCGGDENSAQDVGAFNNGVQALIMATGAHVLVLHHPGKNPANGARGSSALLGAVDTEIEVVPGRMRPTKQRDVELGEDVLFHLERVVVGMDDDGDDITSCVVAAGEAAPSRPSAGRPRAANSRQAVLLDVLRELSPANDPVPIATWREACAEFLPAQPSKANATWATARLRMRQAGLIVERPDGMVARRLE